MRKRERGREGVGAYLECAHDHQIEPIELRQKQYGNADEAATWQARHGRPHGGSIDGNTVAPHDIWPHADAAHKEGGQHCQTVENVCTGILQSHCAQYAAHRDKGRGELHHEHVTVDAMSSSTYVLQRERERERRLAQRTVKRKLV